MFINFYTFFISYIFIICASLGYGFLICNLIDRSLISKNLGYVGLVGIFFLQFTLILQVYYLHMGYIII